jgi:hypothetical protein
MILGISCIDLIKWGNKFNFRPRSAIHQSSGICSVSYLCSYNKYMSDYDVARLSPFRIRVLIASIASFWVQCITSMSYSEYHADHRLASKTCGSQPLPSGRRNKRCGSGGYEKC